MPKWEKLGRLFDPKPNHHPKLTSHAANPLPVHLKNDVYRIFFSGRDATNRSSVGAVDIDIIRREIVTEHSEPFFEHGPAGSFYADGVSIGNCYTAGGGRYMLFMGWQAPKNSHWRGDIGRLEVLDDLTLKLDRPSPFMGATPEDPISLSYPWVMQHGEGDYAMWYGSTISWQTETAEMLHVIKGATSKDGHEWARHGLAVPYELGVAQAFSRPSVVRNSNGTYDMWFSYRSGTGESYRIGYASSVDGKTWRLDLENTGIDVSQHGWDRDMIEYPFVFDHAGQRFMLYNGNGYGKTGFGLAAMADA
ncbi:hypothetical protein KX928_23765 [Roseobacter sp. YSTF-M11]|uniref:Glycosyl hydrolase family 32 N-terminal domain-containing protein n=1 Tax=Roseobacter insulae TaxID=2859783 RepID=A0A9X1K106_9RHOB|nr:hypothetical protein [Roseobacter insulae]MBW4710820.1 hypothetical protein [Roseobacter insulae]